MKGLVPIPITPEPKEQESRRCCHAALLLLLIPVAEFFWIVSESAPVWFVRTPWLVAAPWIACSAVGLAFGVRACGLVRRTRYGLPLLAAALHVGSLLFLGVFYLLSETAP